MVERGVAIDVAIDEICEMLRVRKLEGCMMEEGLEMGVREVEDGVMEGLEQGIKDGEVSGMRRRRRRREGIGWRLMEEDPGDRRAGDSGGGDGRARRAARPLVRRQPILVPLHRRS